jgi:hypothetical protein
MLSRGSLTLRTLNIGLPVTPRGVHRASLNGAAIPAAFSPAANIVHFETPVNLRAGEWLEVAF